MGVSRAKAADLASTGSVLVDGVPAAKSDRLAAGAWLEVSLPEVRPVAPPQPVPGLAVLYEDDDLIAVDAEGRPAGLVDLQDLPKMKLL